jgi:hypothetical protein
MQIVENLLIVSNWMAASLIAVFLIKYMPNIESKPIIDLFICNILFIGLRAFNRQIEVDQLIDNYNSTIINSILSFGIAIYFCYWLHHNYGTKLKNHGNIKNQVQNNTGGHRSLRNAERENPAS